MNGQQIIEEFKVKNPKSRLLYNNNYTKKFINFNKLLLSNGDTKKIVFDENKIYNELTKRIVNKDKYYKKKGGLRSKFNNNDFVINEDSFFQPTQYIKNFIKPQIRSAEQSATETDIYINQRLLNDNLKLFLDTLRPTSKIYTLRAGDTFFALNSTTIGKLADALKPNVVLEEIFDSGRPIVIAWREFKDLYLNIRSKGQGNSIIDGAFFKHTHTLNNVDLSRYGVYREVDHKNYEINCLCRAFESAGEDITAIKALVRNSEIPMRQLKVIAQKLNVYISVRRVEDKKHLRKYGDPKNPHIELGLIDNHYFLIEKTEYTSFSIKNYFKDFKNKNKILGEEKFFNNINCLEKGKLKKRKDKYISSYEIVKILLENKETHLEEIGNCNELYKTGNLYQKVDVFTDLSYNENIYDKSWTYNKELGIKTCKIIEGNLKHNKPLGERKETRLDSIFFDFETTTRRKDKKDTIHKPYCVYTDRNKLGYWGVDCGRKMLIDLCRKYGVKTDKEAYSYQEECNGKEIMVDEVEEIQQGKRFLRLIAHNSAYDFRFILKYLSSVETIEKGTGLMNANACFYHDGMVLGIQIRDSLKMINMPLKKFGGAFKLKVKKEIMPYDLYSEENVDKVWVDINECLEWVSKADKKEYLENCDRWDCIDRKSQKINILTYAGEYCYMDCITLKEGYYAFKKLVEEAIETDMTDYISLASMSHDYLVKQGCYEGVLQLSGVPRAFIQKCLVGGRTMCRNNKKAKYNNVEDDDFDAVSLYPSAMARMDGFLKGKPKIIKNFNEIKKTADGYFVCIKIKKIGKKLAFPLASLIDEKSGVRNFTNDLEDEIIYIDKTALEDLVKFQEVDFEFINGYYYNKGFNNKVNETMTHLFNQRLKYKKDKNPVQMIFKEIMNSSYGKSALKPIDSDCDYIPADSFNAFVDRNFNYIKEATLLANGKYYKVKTMKTIDEHYNNVHIGVSILSWSKRIMNEVMALAEDHDLIIKYQDTDSMHISSKDVDILEVEFKKKYNRDLIGNQLGQFHTDFDMKGSAGDIKAVDSIFLSKKNYLDRLKSVDKEGNEITDYHIRMKGIPEDCIKFKADKEYDGDLMALYNDLYEGKTIEFDLLAVRPKFEMCKNMEIISRTTFKRKITIK